MTKEQLFQQNLSYWANYFPKAAIQLPFVSCDHLILEDTTNLKKVFHGKGEYYHSLEDPVNESSKWFSEINLENVDALYVFGVGLGYGYESAKKWLEENPNHNLIFLEDDLAVIHRLFETERGSRLLHDPQVHLIYLESLDFKKSTIEELYWQFSTIKISVDCLPYYKKVKPKFFEELKQKIIYEVSLRFAVIDEYLRCGAGYFRNFYPNMLMLPGSYLGNHFFGKFPKIPAIICGAGPSLDKQLNILSKLKDKAIIFAGGSSLNALQNAGITPHFGIGIDPNSMQYARLSSNKTIEVPFLFRNRMYHDALKLVTGPRLYVTGSGGYDIAKWFEERLGIAEKEDLDEGFNVVNFSLSIAHAFKCDPIIFIGLDLAFTDLKVYSKGIIGEVAVKETHLLGQDIESAAILKEDINGNPVYTLWKWVVEANWIGDFVKSHPEMTIFNATEGGLKVPNVPNVLFSEIVNQKLTENYAIDEKIQNELKKSLIKEATPEKMQELFDDFSNSLKNCVEHLSLLIQDYERMNVILEQSHKDVVQQSGLAALAETELSEEPAYQFLLEVFNVVYSKLLNQEYQKVDVNSEGLWEKQFKKNIINLKRLAFLRDVAETNIAFIDYAVKSSSHKD